MKHQIQSLRARATDCLRRACGRISPDARVKVIVAAFCLFAVVNILVVASAIRNIGRDYNSPSYSPSPSRFPFERMMLPDNRDGEADSLGLELRRFPDDNFNTGKEESDDTDTE